MLLKYNERISTLILNYLKKCIEKVQVQSPEGTSIKIKKTQMIDSDSLDINYLRDHKMTGIFTLKISFEIIKDHNKLEYDEDLSIPKMIENCFVFEGALRIPTSYLCNDDQVTIYESNLRINNTINIQFDADEPEDFNQWKLQIYDEDSPVDVEGTPDNFAAYAPQLLLTDTEVEKIKVKLDTDEVSNVLTHDLTTKLIMLGPDKKYDNIIDKKIYSPESNLMKYLSSRQIRGKIITSMRAKFNQYGRIYLKDIQSAIDRYFKTAASGMTNSGGLDIPKLVNPLVFDALRYKVTIPEQTAVNESMTDILDAVNTPINTGSCNTINELNVCVDIKDDEFYINCYTYPKQDPIQVKYTTYCTKKVILNSSWDYDNKSFANQGKPVQYKLRTKLRSGSENEAYDYIEPMPDDKLSITSRRIPLGNMSDPGRIFMGTGMHKQSIVIEDSEPALVSAGHDDDDMERASLMTIYEGDGGTVTLIKNGKVYIKDDRTGSVEFFEIPKPIIGEMNTTTNFVLQVKLNDKVKKGDKIIVPEMNKRKSFELGCNANIVFLNYLGYTLEDGVVVSKSCADRFRNYSIYEVTSYLYPDDIIKYIKPIGSKVTLREVLVNKQSRVRITQATQKAYQMVGGVQGAGIEFKQENVMVPNNCDEGYVAAVKFGYFPNPTDKKKNREFSNAETTKIIEEYSKSKEVDDWKDVPDKYKKLTPKEPQDITSAVGYVSITIVRVERLVLGSKMSNRYGGKGVVSLILPDECMPQIQQVDGTLIPAEICLNPASVLHRKNISQVSEVALTKICYEVFNRMNSYIKGGRISDAKEFLHEFYGNRFDNMKDDELVSAHNEKGIYLYRFETGFYSKINPDMIKQWMDNLKIKDTNRIFLPDVVIVERTKLGQGVEVVPKDKYVAQPGDKAKTFELGWCEQECLTGRMYMLKLYHNSTYKSKCTPEYSTTMEPLLGRGKYRGTEEQDGQSIGEMELWVLLESGTQDFLLNQSSSLVSNQYSFLNELLLAGYTMTDNDGLPILSSMRVKQEQLKDTVAAA